VGKAIAKHWPLVTALAILWLVVAVILILSVKQNEGHLVYALDDPYIHMAMARNLAQHGVWGVVSNEFSSSSSSLWWTLTLSVIFFVFGVHEAVPLILNTLLATLTVLSVYWILGKWRTCLTPFYKFIVLSGMVFLTPLPALIFAGQEHVLHTLVTILFVYLSAKALSEGGFSFPSGDSVSLLLLAPFLTLIRYESLFLILVMCVLFLLRRQWLFSLSLGVLAIIPIAAYGIISVANGWLWLPNSILLKGSLPDLTSVKSVVKLFGYLGYERLVEIPHLLSLTVLCLVLYLLRFDRQKGIWESGQIMIIVFVGTTLLHLEFADTGWFYRYEAYLVALGLLVVATTSFEFLCKAVQGIDLDKAMIPKHLGILTLALFAALPLAKRGRWALKQVPQATSNIHEQQYQIGLFLKQFYQGMPVAANDIGAITYLADVRCLDLYGLASLEVARNRLSGAYDREQICDLARSNDARVAIVYDTWFRPGGMAGIPHDRPGGIPSQWIKVGQWEIANNAVCGHKVVSFYATDPSEEDHLISNLRQFASELPRSVKQSGKYLE